MFRKEILTLLVLATGLCYCQTWREKPLSHATFKRNGIEHIQMIANLKKGIITYPAQFRGVNFDPNRFILGKSSSFYDAAISWEERDYDDITIKTSHQLDSSMTCPLTMNEDNLLNLLVEFEVLRISRAPAHKGYKPSDSYDQIYLTFVYDSVKVVSFLDKFEALPYVLYVNVPIMSSN